MLKPYRRLSVPYLAYVSLLVALVSLGVLVAALATGNVPAAGVAGVALIACFGGAVAGFRVGARNLTQVSDAYEPGTKVSMFSTPLSRDQIDRYLENYRSMRANSAQASPLTTKPRGGTSTARDVSRTGARERARAEALAPDRLSA